MYDGGGSPAARQAQEPRTGQSPHLGARAVQTSAPSSITAAFQRADVPASSGRSWAARRISAAVSEGSREREAGDQPGVDAPDVGIHHGFAPPVGESRHSRCRIAAHSRQRQQCGVVVRNLASVVLQYCDCCCVQPQRAAGIAEPAPGAHSLAGRLPRKPGRGWPAFQPFLPDGQHPHNRGLLQHDLTYQDTPGRTGGLTPGQVAGNLRRTRSLIRLCSDCRSGSEEGGAGAAVELRLQCRSQHCSGSLPGWAEKGGGPAAGCDQSRSALPAAWWQGRSAGVL
jgi:hypothetical protein